MLDLEEIKRIKIKVEPDLLTLPGVTGVGVGYKYVQGKQTDRLAIHVFVEKKKPLQDLPEKEVIPKEIQGVPTDVIERRFVLHAES